MRSYSAGYNPELDKTQVTEHFNYVLIDKNSNEHLIMYRGGKDITSPNTIVKGIEFKANSRGTYDGNEIELEGSIIRKDTDITIANIVRYIFIN